VTVRTGRAAQQSAGGGLTLAALLLFLAAALNGCRDNGIPHGPEPSPSFRLRVSLGDRFLYHGSDINRYGYRIDSTAARHTWQVVSTTGQIAGFADVIVIADSAVILATSTIRRDTLYFRSTPDGSLYRYGFLSSLILQRENRVIPPSWDLLIMPGAGPSGSWTVGPTDSPGTRRVYGKIAAGETYFDVTVNGTPGAFPAYRCDLIGPDLEYHLWMADSPPCLPRLEEYPDSFNGVTKGSVLVLSEVVTAPNR